MIDTTALKVETAKASEGKPVVNNESGGALGSFLDLATTGAFAYLDFQNQRRLNDLQFQQLASQPVSTGDAPRVPAGAPQQTGPSTNTLLMVGGAGLLGVALIVMLTR